MTAVAAAPTLCCPHCGSSYKTFLKAGYRQEVKGNTKVSIVTERHYRCMKCGKNYAHTEKENNR